MDSGGEYWTRNAFPIACTMEGVPDSLELTGGGLPAPLVALLPLRMWRGLELRRVGDGDGEGKELNEFLALLPGRLEMN
jgi:hypothetical protein